MQNTESEHANLIHLSRGGYLLKTSAGNLQFGCPPETIKDTMVMPEKVPSLFLLPGALFHVEKGIAVAELEFPIYFNHFVLNKKVLVIGSEEQCKRLRIVLQESVFGPEVLDIARDFADGKDNPFFPDLKAEMNFFRSDRELDDIVEFGVFKNDIYHFNGITIHRQEGQGFHVTEDESGKKTELPWNIDYRVQYKVGNPLNKPFEAPDFAVTCLGPSHGFDATDNTSGFILWLNQRGIMIDPPVNSTEWLHDSHVNPKLIRHVILTHCHADHDAGTFQKILEENTITIHSTQTVMESFLRKYSALTQIPVKHLCKLFHFRRIFLNQPVYIEGGEFLFHYTLHSIPTIGFKLKYGGQSFLYSSDHLNHPETIIRMGKARIFPEGRLGFLLNFPWETDIIYHEAGIPPLHTPVAYLASLPSDIQKKITVYHIATQDFPKDTQLTLAKFGMENTLFFDTEVSPYERAIRDLDVMTHVELFSNFSATKARDFLSMAKEEFFSKDAVIVKKGSLGNKFYMIVSGQVAVVTEQNEHCKIYEKYDYFGEASLISNENRSADVIALTDVQLLVLEKHAFLSFIEGSSLSENLQRLSKTRQSNSWDILANSSLFSSMTSYQKTRLEGILIRHKITRGEKLAAQGKPTNFFHILIDGVIEVKMAHKTIIRSNMGDFIGDLSSIADNAASTFEATVLEDGKVYCISQKDMADFIADNPGIYMRLLHKEQ